MTQVLLPKQHPFLLAGQDISSLCAPLFEQHSMNLFVYGKYYRDGSCLLLSNNTDWISSHLANGYPAPAPVPTELLKKSAALHLIPKDEGPFQQAKYDLLQKYNTAQAIDFISKEKDYYEVFCFSFPSAHYDPINTIINNLENFKRFTLHFKDHTKRLLSLLDKSKIILPETMRGIDFSNPALANTEMLSKYNFANKSFTKRETDILHHLMRGQTARRIGEKLNLSKRTIEAYLANMKYKMNVSSKAELIEKIVENKITNTSQ